MAQKPNGNKKLKPVPAKSAKGAKEVASKKAAPPAGKPAKPAGKLVKPAAKPESKGVKTAVKSAPSKPSKEAPKAKDAKVKDVAKGKDAKAKVGPEVKEPPKRKRKGAEAIRLKAYWGVFNQTAKRVAVFEYAERKAADKKATDLSASSKQNHYVQLVKEIIRDTE
jgi:hypothetical protein